MSGIDVTVTVPEMTASTAEAIPPIGLYVGADLDTSPYRPPRASMRGWRVAVGPPVIVSMPVAAASVAATDATATVGLESIRIFGTASADAVAPAPVVAATYGANPEVASAQATSPAPELSASGTIPAPHAVASVDAPPPLVLQSTEVDGAASASVDAIPPTLLLLNLVSAEVASASADAFPTTLLLSTNASAEVASASAETVAPVLKFTLRFSDDFNRADTNTLGANWVDKHASIGVLNNGAYPVGNNVGKAARWIDELITDDIAVQATYLSGQMGLIMGADSGTQAYLLPTTAGQLRIFTSTNWGVGGNTQRASVSITLSVNDVFRLERVGNVYTGYQNGVSKVTWTDSTDIVARGAGKRYVGILLATASTAAAADNWSAEDI